MADFKIPPMVKPRVDRSNFNFSAPRRLSANVGLHIPVYVKPVLPGDEWRISDITARIRTNPFVSPLMGSFRVQLDWFFNPNTNLYGFMDNNSTLSTSAILNQQLHRICFLKNGFATNANSTANVSNDAVAWFCMATNQARAATHIGIGHVPPASLFNFLGLPADFDVMFSGGLPFTKDFSADGPFPYAVATDIDTTTASPDGEIMDDVPSFCLDSYYTYWDICRNYYMNTQFGYLNMYVGDYSVTSGNAQTLSSDTNVVRLDSSDLDGMFLELRSLQGNDRCIRDLTLIPSSAPHLKAFWTAVRPYTLGNFIWDTLDNVPSVSSGQRIFLNPFTGLCCARFRPDYYQAVMQPSNAYEVSVDVENNSFTINTLRLMSHMQQLYDLYDASGGRFNNWMSMQFDVDVSDNIDRPVLLNSSHYYLNVDDIYSATQTNPTNSDGSDGVSVGEQFGMVNTGCGLKGVKFRSRYHGTLMAILTIVPEVDYSQGIDGINLYKRFSDIYSPAMSQLGYEEMTRWDFCTGVPIPSDSTYYSIMKKVTPGADPETSWSTIPAKTVQKAFLGMSVVPNTDPTSRIYSSPTAVVGRNVHWWRYMSDVGRVYGNLSYSQPLESWTNQRSYLRNRYLVKTDIDGSTVSSLDGVTYDYSPYVNPDDYQYYFAYQESGSQNWQVQFSYDISVSRPIPKYVLGRIV